MTSWQTDDIDSTSVLCADPYRRSWNLMHAGNGPTSTTDASSIFDGFACSRFITLHRRGRTLCQKGRHRHMVDRSHAAGCRQRARGGPAGSVLSAVHGRRHIAERGREYQPLWKLHTRQVVTERRSQLCGQSGSGHSDKM